MNEPDRSVDGVVIHRDVVHTQVTGYRPLALDLYLPTGDVAALCVYTHGGGWLRGSRRLGPGPLTPTSARLFARAARQGLAMASVDYRLSGEAPFPAQAQDVAAAIAHLDAARDRLGLGAAPLVTWGVSAGGQLAALRALDTAAEPRTVACALWYSPSDLRTMPVIPVDDGPSREQRLLGGTVEERAALAAEASPMTHVHADAPPFLLLHGELDNAVPRTESEQLHEALGASGVDSTLEIVAGYDHMFAGMPDEDVEAHVDRTTQFLLARAR